MCLLSQQKYATVPRFWWFSRFGSHFEISNNVVFLPFVLCRLFWLRTKHWNHEGGVLNAANHNVRPPNVYHFEMRTLFSFYKNIFYKNIEAEICEILNEHFKNKAEAEILKRIDIILCWNTCKYNIRTILLFLSLNGETSQQNEKTCTRYSKMFNANDSSMNGTCNIYEQYSAQKT